MKIRMRTLTIMVIGGFATSVLVGCTYSGPKPFTRDFYLTPKVAVLSVPLPALSVHQFIDERWGATDPTMVYRFDSISARFGESSFSKSVNEVRATEPVAVGVARAVLEGFQARGVRVIDMTASSFEPGHISGDTRIGITGRVIEFGVRVIRSGLHEYHSVIGCKIALEAHEAGSGQKLWEKTYSRQEEGVSRTLASAVPEKHWQSLSRVLAAMVEEVVNDPELLQVLQ
jgi:hypothetical protein